MRAIKAEFLGQQYHDNIIIIIVIGETNLATHKRDRNGHNSQTSDQGASASNNGQTRSENVNRTISDENNTCMWQY